MPLQLDAYREQQVMAKQLLPIYQQQYDAIQKFHRLKMTSKDSLLEIRKTLLEANYNVKSIAARVREEEANSQHKMIEFKARIAEKICEVEKDKIERLQKMSSLFLNCGSLMR